jgi:hypothetical protein
MAKRFFYVSGGILMLALAYHFGAMSAQAQAPGNPVVAVMGCGAVITANGDIYEPLGGSCNVSFPFHHDGNVFAGGPTPAKAESFGQLKARYRP